MAMKEVLLGNTGEFNASSFMNIEIPNECLHTSKSTEGKTGLSNGDIYKKAKSSKSNEKDVWRLLM